MKPFGKRYGWMFLPVLLLANVLFVAGCSDDDSTKPPDEFAPPTNLTYENEIGEVTLRWDATPDETLADFAGYQVYRSATSLIGATVEELEAAELNPSLLLAGTLEYSTAAAAGTKYYYSVRSVKDNGDLSQPSNEIDTAAVTGGILTLGEFADPSQDSAMDFSEGATYSFMVQFASHVDIYLGTTADDDAADQPLALKSPSIVASDAPEWDLRIAGLKLLAEADDGTTGATGFSDSITLGANVGEIVGKVIAVRIPLDEDQQTHYGKLVITGYDSSPGERSIQVQFTYQPIEDYIRF